MPRGPNCHIITLRRMSAASLARHFTQVRERKHAPTLKRASPLR